MTPTLRLARWLGPWASSHALPRSVVIRNQDVDGPNSRISVKVYRPERVKVRGVYLISQGLHFLGPDDPRMDRFCRTLANAGFEVVAPRLPTFMNMHLRTEVIAEFKHVYLELERLTTVQARPALFSISFGALPVLRLAGDPEVGDRISSVVTFGGYVDWMAALYYTIEGRVQTRDGVFQREPDPLNQPAIFMNMLAGMDLQPQQQEALYDAWLTYLRRTWGRDECRERSVHEPIAKEVSLGLQEELRAMFILGCGLGDQREALRTCLAINEKSPHLGGALDVASYLGQIRVPVHLFHGLDDDVFPYTQMDMLKDAFPRTASVNTYLTGLYGHTGSQGGPKGSLLRELQTMFRMLNVLANAPERP